MNEEEELVVHPKEGELLVILRNLTKQGRKEEEQRDYLSHTRRNVHGKVCDLIIDSGSCTNVASTTLAFKLNLATTKQSYPCNLQWLNNGGAMKVKEQVVVPFTIGRYKDEVICDVVSMNAGHLLFRKS